MKKKHLPGIKLQISGKGRCNLTNSAAMKEFIDNIPGNGKFLYSALSRFDNNDLLAFFSDLGVSTKVERGGRVFPRSDKAKDVVAALVNYLKLRGAEFKLEKPINKLWIEGNLLKGVLFEGLAYSFPVVIVATGGKAYPKTGSTGDGYTLAAQAGHSIVKPLPSLVPLVIKDKWISKVQGLALKNVKVTAIGNSAVLGSEFGEMLFTHFGVSGPIILTLSRSIVRYINATGNTVDLIINLKPALSIEQIDLRLQKDFERYSNKQFKNSLDDFLPKSLISPIVKLSKINSSIPVHQISKEQRMHLATLIQNLKLEVVGYRSFDEAIVTSGGVNLKEVDPKTLGSKLIEGLYFAGEVLDIDGFTGGYNLQIAFSTGLTAGQSAAEYSLNLSHNIY